MALWVRIHAKYWQKTHLRTSMTCRGVEGDLCRNRELRRFFLLQTLDQVLHNFRSLTGTGYCGTDQENTLLTWVSADSQEQCRESVFRRGSWRGASTGSAWSRSSADTAPPGSGTRPVSPRGPRQSGRWSDETTLVTRHNRLQWGERRFQAREHNKLSPGRKSGYSQQALVRTGSSDGARQPCEVREHRWNESIS